MTDSTPGDSGDAPGDPAARRTYKQMVEEEARIENAGNPGYTGSGMRACVGILLVIVLLVIVGMMVFNLFFRR
ncbi:MAG: hypothetical protein HY286_14530 [Planctomycetes bacterium]|nr:hypothetical protein [Planctomycetota bacterium]